MKIAFCSDVHLGNHRVLGGSMERGLNRRCREAIASFQNALAVAKSSGCEVFIIAGDLFDTANPPPTLIEAAQLAINGCGMQVVLMLGNHEQGSTELGHHSLAPLWQCAEVVERPCSMLFGKEAPIEVSFLPYRPAPTKEWLAKEMINFEAVQSPRRILCMHMGIEDAHTDLWLRGSRDAVHVETLETLMHEGNYTFATAGHWHDGEIWESQGRTIIQLGALVPTGFDNPGPDFGSLFVIDGDLGMVEHRVSGPRFEKLPWDEEAVAGMRAQYEKDDLYLSVQAQPSELEAALQAVQRAKDEGWVKDATVVPSAASARRSAVKAALAARQASTLAEAVEQFVRKIALPAEVDRAAVRTQVMAYLEGNYEH